MLKPKSVNVRVASSLCLMLGLSALVMTPADARRFGFGDVVNTIKEVGGAASSFHAVRDGYRSAPSPPREEPSSSTSVSGTVVTPVVPPPIPPVPPPSPPSSTSSIPGAGYDTNKYFNHYNGSRKAYGGPTGDQSSSTLSERNVHNSPPPPRQVRVTRVVRERPAVVVQTPKVPDIKPIINPVQPDKPKPPADTISKFDTKWVDNMLSLSLTKI